MNNFKTIQRINDRDDTLSSQSSDEKMDTGSESILSAQNTPNSVLSSDFDEKEPNEVLRLQNPTDNTQGHNSDVLRLSGPVENIDNIKESSVNLEGNWNDSLVENMANLKIDVQEVSRPQHLEISPPRVSSTLTLATDHPLMGIGSPDSVENYPDIIPERPLKALSRNDEGTQKKLSILCTEETGPHVDSLNFSGFYNGPQRNTSKNNLYFSENFSSIEDRSKTDKSTNSPPDVARIHNPVLALRDSEFVNQKQIRDVQDQGKSTPKQTGAHGDVTEKKRFEFNNFGQSTPKSYLTDPHDIPIIRENFQSEVAEWCESPSHLRSIPNFELPIEMSSNIGTRNDLDSPDVSTPTDDRSSYQALLDPYSGNVALRHTPNKNNNSSGQRRKIIVMQDTEDKCSLDSVSVESLKSEEADVPLSALEEQVPQPETNKEQEASITDDDSRRNSMSECSEPIPEYSAAEERDDTRSWLKVPLPTGGYGSCDMRVIEPYKRVLSHGGYGPGRAAVIVFGACHLPDTARPDYHYVMDNLFMYVIWTLERLVTDEYVVVYLHGSAARRKLPTFRWLVECYRLVDRRLRKNLKHLYLVHPTFWLKSLMLLTKPFVSSKFYRKVTYVNSLAELDALVKVERNAIPDSVWDYDAARRR